MGDLVAIATQQQTIAMVAKQNPKGFSDSIASIVSETIQISGRKDITDADKAFLILKTKEEIESEYKFLTGSEIRYAFSQGVRGRFGDYYHINLPTFIKWLDKYLESDERQRVLDSRQKRVSVKYQLAESNPISDKDMAELYRGKANYNYKKFLETGIIETSGLKSLQQIFEGFIFKQMRKDGKVRINEKTIKEVFIRYRDNGKKVIYEGY